MSDKDIQFYRSLLADDHATALYEYFRSNIEWDNNIALRNSRNEDYTLKTKSIELGSDEIVDSTIRDIISKISIYPYTIYGIRLNYYRDGDDHTPSHIHTGIVHMILSLGATRTLNLDGENYDIKNGDCVRFGIMKHGVPKEPSCTDGRISMVLYLKK